MVPARLSDLPKDTQKEQSHLVCSDLAPLEPWSFHPMPVSGLSTPHTIDLPPWFMAFLPGGPGDVINLFLPAEACLAPSATCTASASSPDNRSIPSSSMVPRNNLRLRLDSLNQALAQSSPSDNFIGPEASYFSVCFHPGFLVLDQPGWCWICCSMYYSRARAPCQWEETHWLECNWLCDLEGVTVNQPAYIELHPWAQRSVG